MPIPLNEVQLFSNNAVSLLAFPITASSTQLSVIPGHGAMFPNPGPGEFFLITLENQAATAREIIKVTSRSGDTLNFGLADRGQEGTTPQAWNASLGDDTLVDHRVTAETMTRAMQLPESTGGGGGATTLNDLTDVDTATVAPAVGQTLKWNGTNWVPGNDNDTIFTPGSINAFTDVDTTGATVGQVLRWNGTNWVPHTLPTGGTAWINGENTLGTSIDPGWQIPVSTASYDTNNRTFKYIVTVEHVASFTTRAFEILLCITGNLGTNAEAVHATQYATVGPQVQGDLHATINTALKTVSLEWENLEATPVVVNVTRIQHYPV